METANELIARIQRLIKARGITVNNALIESGVGEDFIACIEREQALPAKRFIDLAQYLEVSLDMLLTGNESGINAEMRNRLCLRASNLNASDITDNGVDVSLLNDIIEGTIQPSFDNYIGLVFQLGISFEEFVGQEIPNKMPVTEFGNRRLIEAISLAEQMTDSELDITINSMKSLLIVREQPHVPRP